MIPAWMTSLLSIDSVEEFSFSYNEGGHKILIEGKRVNGEWVLNVRVEALPYFAWGCNKFNTRMKDSAKSVKRYYLMYIFNQLSEQRSSYRDKLMRVIKDSLE